MGTYKSKAVKGNVYEMDLMEESPPEVKAKTRQPMPDLWKLNILRGKREDEIKDEAMPIARRRCRRKATEFIKCERENGKYWTVFECIEQYETMNECFQRELDIAADLIRRDMPRHPEWWWRDLYDEDGEVGQQAAWKDEWWGQLLFNKLRNKYFVSGGAATAAPLAQAQNTSQAATSSSSVDKNTTAAPTTNTPN